MTASIEASAELPVALGGSDLEGCRALSDEAGWNQTVADWGLLLVQGAGFGYAAPGGKLVASAVVLPFGGEIAWIGMVLVTAARRRRGLASRLLGRCLAYCRERGLAVGLDATPAGAAVYGGLGFEPVSAVTRWQAAAPARSSGTDGVRPLEKQDLARAAALDRVAFGADRGLLLAALLERAGGRAFVDEAGGGFVLARDGRVAWQLGPLVARDTATARRLLAAALAANGGAPALVDACGDALGAPLQAAGFTIQRGFERMRLGSAEPFGDPALLYAIAGPELG